MGVDRLDVDRVSVWEDDCTCSIPQDRKEKPLPGYVRTDWMTSSRTMWPVRLVRRRQHSRGRGGLLLRV